MWRSDADETGTGIAVTDALPQHARLSLKGSRRRTSSGCGSCGAPWSGDYPPRRRARAPYYSWGSGRGGREGKGQGLAVGARPQRLRRADVLAERDRDCVVADRTVVAQQRQRAVAQRREGVAVGAGLERVAERERGVHEPARRGGGRIGHRQRRVTGGDGDVRRSGRVVVAIDARRERPE